MWTKGNVELLTGTGLWIAFGTLFLSLQGYYLVTMLKDSSFLT